MSDSCALHLCHASLQVYFCSVPAANVRFDPQMQDALHMKLDEYTAPYRWLQEGRASLMMSER